MLQQFEKIHSTSTAFLSECSFLSVEHHMSLCENGDCLWLLSLFILKWICVCIRSTDINQIWEQFLFVMLSIPIFLHELWNCCFGRSKRVCSDCSFKAVNQSTQTREKWLVATGSVCVYSFCWFCKHVCYDGSHSFFLSQSDMWKTQTKSLASLLRFTSSYLQQLQVHNFVVNIVIVTSSQCTSVLFVWIHGETETFPKYKRASVLFQRQEEKFVLQIVTVRVSHKVVNL